MQFFFFKGSYGIDMDIIHLFVLFEHRCHVHYLLYAYLYHLNIVDVCLFVLFTHKSHAHDFHV